MSLRQRERETVSESFNLTFYINVDKCGSVVGSLPVHTRPSLHTPVKRKKLGLQILPQTYLIGTVNLSFQMTKIRSEFQFKCLCPNGSRNKLI